MVSISRKFQILKKMKWRKKISSIYKNKGIQFQISKKKNYEEKFSKDPKILMVFPFKEEIQVLKQKNEKEEEEKLHISNNGTIKH